MQCVPALAVFAAASENPPCSNRSIDVLDILPEFLLLQPAKGVKRLRLGLGQGLYKMSLSQRCRASAQR